jgi:hypothetical protein
MFGNPQSIITLQAEWDGVVHMRERMDHLVSPTFSYDPITTPVFGNIFYNLPMLLAFDVLKDFLLYVKDQGLITSPDNQLEQLLESAKIALPWIDWQCLREGAERQTELAHQGKLFGDKQCLQDIQNVEIQLVAWGAIASA